MGTRACPFCAEEILDAAVKCKHCGSMLNGAFPPPTGWQPPQAPPQQQWAPPPQYPPPQYPPPPPPAVQVNVQQRGGGGAGAKLLGGLAVCVGVVMAIVSFKTPHPPGTNAGGGLAVAGILVAFVGLVIFIIGRAQD